MDSIEVTHVSSIIDKEDAFDELEKPCNNEGLDFEITDSTVLAQFTAPHQLAPQYTCVDSSSITDIYVDAISARMEQACEFVKDTFRKFPNVQMLTMLLDGYNEAVVLPVIDGAAVHWPRLTRLELSCDRECAGLFQSLGNLENIHTFVFKTKLMNIYLLEFMEMTEKWAHLQCLRLSGGVEVGEGDASLKLLDRCGDKLRELTFYSEDILPVKFFCSIPDKCPNLQEFTMCTGAGITDDTFADVMPELIRRLRRLTLGNLAEKVSLNSMNVVFGTDNADYLERLSLLGNVPVDDETLLQISNNCTQLNFFVLDIQQNKHDVTRSGLNNCLESCFKLRDFELSVTREFYDINCLETMQDAFPRVCIDIDFDDSLVSDQN